MSGRPATAAGVSCRNSVDFAGMISSSAGDFRQVTRRRRRFTRVSVGRATRSEPLRRKSAALFRGDRAFRGEGRHSVPRSVAGHGEEHCQRLESAPSRRQSRLPWPCAVEAAPIGAPEDRQHHKSAPSSSGSVNNSCDGRGGNGRHCHDPRDHGDRGRQTRRFKTEFAEEQSRGISVHPPEELPRRPATVHRRRLEPPPGRSRH